MIEVCNIGKSTYWEILEKQEASVPPREPRARREGGRGRLREPPGHLEGSAGIPGHSVCGCECGRASKEVGTCPWQTERVIPSAKLPLLLPKLLRVKPSTVVTPRLL